MTGKPVFSNVKFEAMKLELPENLAALPDEEVVAAFQKADMANYEKISKELEEQGADCKDVILHAYFNDEKGITVEVVRVGGSKVGDDECKELLSKVCENLDAYKIKISGLSDEDLKLLAYNYTVEINYLGADGKISPEEDTGIGGGQFGVAYAIMFIVAMVCIMSWTCRRLPWFRLKRP